MSRRARTERDKVATITSFDKDLSEKFWEFERRKTGFDNDLYRRFVEWIEKGETKTKSKVAGKLLFDLLEKRVRRYLTTDGLQRIKIIMDSLHRFEGFIEQFRTGFARKIYRDHLNHMIRTTMMASYLGKLLNLPSHEIRKLEAASLFHDAAYPVQEAATIFTRIKDDLEGAYSTVNFSGSFQHL
ncbi:unnamed protein product [marine sediment metagenome]|uniref:HD domain-containing protein n=1 Tax=marine sediment metagenome TaxID=412755 RepID=X1AD18_9ZZZZ